MELKYYWNKELRIKIYFVDLALVLFGLGTIGFIFNRNNLILMIISIEIILLAVSIMTLFFSWQFNDILAEVFGLYIIAVAGAESAIGLAIVIAYFKIRKV
jgi:NADH:ubiquinone oxidoreductase subunit K